MSSTRRPTNRSGRSSGVLCSYLFVEVPCRSGSPHGVRGGVHVVRLPTLRWPPASRPRTPRTAKTASNRAPNVSQRPVTDAASNDGAFTPDGARRPASAGHSRGPPEGGHHV